MFPDQPLGEPEIVHLRGHLRQDVERPLRRGDRKELVNAFEAGEDLLPHPRDDVDAPAGILAPDPQRLQRDRLGNRGSADDHRVLDLDQVVEEVRGRDQETDPPARHSVRLGEAVERDRVVPAAEGARGEVRGAVVGEVFVGLVADVVDPLPGTEDVDFRQRLLRIDDAGGIVRGHRDDRARPGRQGTLDRVDARLVVPVRRNADRLAAIRFEGYSASIDFKLLKSLIIS